ncbi:MAG: PDZ domain-containing protein [Candidatus Omnitrophota bacterium]
MRSIKPIFVIVTIALMCMICSACLADTVIMQDGERRKGVVVEEHNDRIVLSGMEGEKQIMRTDTKNIIFDLKEQNLTSFADLYRDKGSYEKAHYYYVKALEVNPNYKKARDGFNYTGTYLQQASRRLKLDHIRRRNEGKEWNRESTVSTAPTEKINEAAKLKENLGIVLGADKEGISVSGIVPLSPAAAAGIKRGDILASVWSRSVSYMQPEEVIKRLLDPGVMDIKVAIIRSVKLNLDNASGKYSALIGAGLGFAEMEGLIVEKVIPGGLAEKARIKKNDLIMDVQGQPTRYMSLEKVDNTISSRKGKQLSLKIKRDVVMWKKFDKEKIPYRNT